ncbi:MAG: hypothetical protein RR313_08130 [Anaerovoracaceae bacterium]
MSYEIITSEMFYNSLFQGFKIVFDICYPIVLPIIIGGVTLAIFKRLVKSIAFNFALVTGSTTREARKKSKCAGDIVDVVSAVNDLKDIYKK